MAIVASVEPEYRYLPSALAVRAKMVSTKSVELVAPWRTTGMRTQKSVNQLSSVDDNYALIRRP